MPDITPNTAAADAHASTLTRLSREQVTQRPLVSERFKSTQTQRNRFSQEATER